MEIAILNLTRLGDLVQTSPVLAGLHKRHPEARIHLVVKRRFRAAAELLPGVDVLHEIDADGLCHTLMDPATSFLERFAAVRSVVDGLCEHPFDLALNFTHSPVSAALLSLLDVREIRGFTLDRSGQRRVADPWLGHVATVLGARRLSQLNLVDLYLGAAGLIGSGQRLSLRVARDGSEWARQRLDGAGPWLAVQPGASQGLRAWPIDRFAATLREATRRTPGLRIVLLGVRGEAARARALQAAGRDLEITDLVGETSLEALVGVLERVDLLLTGDTGTMHLAAAVGTPTLSLFVAHAWPAETAPYAEGHWVVHSRIACAPCQHLVDCGHPACHDDLPPAWLGRIIECILARRSVSKVPDPPRATLLRTAFDPDGVHEVVPVQRRVAEPFDLMSLALRAAFLADLAGTPVDPERIWAAAQERFGVAPEDWRATLPPDLGSTLSELSQLGSRGSALSRALERAGTRAPELRVLGARLREVDRALAEQARREPLVAPLVTSLELELQRLPDDPGSDLVQLAQLAGTRYAALQRRSERIRSQIHGPGHSPGPARGDLA
ncbi:MAG: glycosyltransferase family 9 protein [Myxococcota bacterium]